MSFPNPCQGINHEDQRDCSAALCTRIRTYEVPVDRMAQDYVDAIYHLPAFQKWYQAAIAEPWKMDDVDNIDKLRSTR